MVAREAVEQGHPPRTGVYHGDIMLSHADDNILCSGRTTMVAVTRGRLTAAVWLRTGWSWSAMTPSWTLTWTSGGLSLISCDHLILILLQDSQTFYMEVRIRSRVALQTNQISLKGILVTSLQNILQTKVICEDMVTWCMMEG